MQTTRHADRDQGSLPHEPEKATGVFTGPDGVAGLYYRKRRFAYVDQIRGLALVLPDNAPGYIEMWNETKVKGGTLRWRCWEMDRLFWSHASALVVLQGANLQHLFRDRFVLISGQPTKVYDPRPGMVDVHLAEVAEAPPGFTTQDVFLTVIEEAFEGKLVVRA